MNRSTLLALCIGMTCSLAPTAAGADKLSKLVDKADMVVWGKSSAGVFAMEVKTASFKRSFTIVSWYDGRGEERMLMKILGPALWRGHGTLKKGSRLKMYNPRSNHVTVVGHSMMGDSWMGSHFSNDDLVKETRLARHYTMKQDKQWKAKNETGTMADFYLVRLTPKPTAPVGWGKILLTFWEHGGLVIPTNIQYFRKAKNKRPHRELHFSQLKKMGDRTIPARMKMTLARKPGEYTAITYKKIKFDIKIPKSKFTEQALRH